MIIPTTMMVPTTNLTPVVSNLSYSNQRGWYINKGTPPVCSHRPAPGFIRDASDDRCLSIRLFALMSFSRPSRRLARDALTHGWTYIPLAN